MSVFLKYTSWFTAYILLCGCLKLYLYYKKFHISILQFLDFTEILTLFMDNIFAYFIVSIIFGISCLLLYRKINNLTNALDSKVILKLYFRQYRVLLILISLFFLVLLIFIWNLKQ
jgi:hypothetical protein